MDPATLAGVLRLAADPGRPDLSALLTGLPVAGFTGSLTNRMDQGPVRRAWPGAGQDRHADERALAGRRRHRRRGHDVRVRADGRPDPRAGGRSRRAPTSTARRPRSGVPARRLHSRSAGRFAACLPVTRVTPTTAWSTGTSPSRSPPGSPATAPWSAVPRPPTPSPSCARRPTRSTGLVREFTGLDAPADTAPVLVVDRGGWARANAEAFRVVTGPLTEQAEREATERLRAQPGGRVAHHRRRGRRAARLPRRQGARPVRPVLRPARPAAPRRAEHRAHRARDRRRPARLPALGVPPRGDPPRPVHRRALDARPPLLRGAGDHRVGRRHRRRGDAPPGRRRRQGRPARRQHRRPAQLSGAEGRCSTASPG